jgi:hypothetical protein
MQGYSSTEGGRPVTDDIPDDYRPLTREELE